MLVCCRWACGAGFRFSPRSYCFQSLAMQPFCQVKASKGSFVSVSTALCVQQLLGLRRISQASMHEDHLSGGSLHDVFILLIPHCMNQTTVFHGRTESRDSSKRTNTPVFRRCPRPGPNQPGPPYSLTLVTLPSTGRAIGSKHPIRHAQLLSRRLGDWYPANTCVKSYVC